MLIKNFLVTILVGGAELRFVSDCISDVYETVLKVRNATEEYWDKDRFMMELVDLDSEVTKKALEEKIKKGKSNSWPGVQVTMTVEPQGLEGTDQMNERKEASG